VTGTSGDIVETFDFTLAVSAANGTGVGSTFILNPFFNVNAAYSDGTTYSTGGLDGAGYSYSSNLLGIARAYNGITFFLGSANQLNAMTCARQSVGPTTAAYSTLYLLGTAIHGSQLSQPFTLHYVDGTVVRAQPSFSEWVTPQNFPGEFEGIAMPYRNFSDGTKDETPVNLYVYRLDLNPSKVFQAIGFPNNPNVIIFAATAVP
jgi:hypothetical protein